MLGEAIRIARAFSGMSQKELAKAMEISGGYLSQIESGDREPSQQTLRLAAKALGLPVSSIQFFSEKLAETENEEDGTARAAFARRILSALAAIEKTANGK